MKLSLGYQVLLAVLLGILVGLFFGPLASALQPIGAAYTMLLQMAVLPYICLSLIHGLGSMSPDIGKKLFKSGWPYLLTIWVAMFILIFFLMQLIPNPIAPLIKTNGTEEFESNFSQHFLTYLIPQNPFYDVANNIVPALALFGLIGGIALMHIEKKEPLIGTLERVNQTIEKILHWLGILSPIAAFAYIGVAFGTIHFEDLPKIEVYVVAFILTSLFVTFWLIPTLLAGLTPLTFKEASHAIRFVCLLPLVTGLATAALPFLNTYLKRLSQKHETHAKFRETSQTVLPIAYSFGNIGNAMCIFLTFFLAFYFRHPFSGLEKFLISILTVPLSIGASTSNLNSMLFLIQELGFPPGAVDFFLELKALTYNFQVMMSTAGILALIILSLYSYYGILRIKWKPLILRLSFSVALVALLVFSAKAMIHLKDNYLNLYMSHKIADVIPSPVPAQIVPPTPSSELTSEPLRQILNSHILRVGFEPESIPYCYYNDQHELVGFDIAYAYQLARDLNCRLEFIPFEFGHLTQNIKDGVFDIGMSSIIMSENRILNMDFTTPYAQENNVLIVPVAKKNQFLNLKEVISVAGLRIGAGGVQVQIATSHFPQAKIVTSYVMDPLIQGEVDAVMWSATSAFIWCLSHPDFVAIDYGNLIGSSYFAYPIRQTSNDFRFFLNNWLALKEQSGFKKEMQSYWIEGMSPKQREPRWSILHNVLHFRN